MFNKSNILNSAVLISIVVEITESLYTCSFSLYVLSDIASGILKPTLAGSNQASGLQPEKLVSDDLDSSLANLVGSKCDALLFSCTN